MGFWLAPKLMALNDFERHNSRYFALLHWMRELLKPTASNWLKPDPYYQWQCSRKNAVFDNIWFMAIFAEITENECTKQRHPLSKPVIWPIGLSVVQGSGIGPVLYAVMKSDLQAISRLNTVRDRCKLDPYYQWQYSPKNAVFDNIWFVAIFAEITENKCTK